MLWLSAKTKTLMTVLIPFARLGLVTIVMPSLHITSKTAVIYLTLILIIYFIAQSAGTNINKNAWLRKSA